MTKQQVFDVLDLYDKRLDSMGAAAVKQSEGGSRLEHLRWMLPEMRNMLQEPNPDMEKVMRWLGFVQGAFWAKGVYSIDEMRDHNRPKV